MSLTTHSPREPCVGHCPACGAFGDWSEIITDLIKALKEAPNPLSGTDWDTHICIPCGVERDARVDGSPCTPFPHLADCWVTKTRALIERAKERGAT